MTQNKFDGTIKLHFKTARQAMAASFDGSATAGERTKSGKTKTWIAHVKKKSPSETAAEAANRFA